MVGVRLKNKTTNVKGSRVQSASWPGILSMLLSLGCAMTYAWTQIPDKPGFVGEVEKQWREGKLFPVEGGPIKFVSGDLSGSGVSDPQFGLVVPSAVLFRNVEGYQYVEFCNSKKECSVKLEWSNQYIDASKFKTKGYSNSQIPSSLIFASRVTIGKSGVAAKAISQLNGLSVPYPINENNNDIHGLMKFNGGYQNFQGDPKPGSFRVSYRHIPLGIGLTMAGLLDQRGDLTPGPNGRFIIKKGAMKPQDLLELEFWQLPRFGLVLLGVCAILFIAGVFGVWSSNKIERQIVEERRRKERRKNARDKREVQIERRNGPRRIETQVSLKPENKAHSK